MTDPIDLEEVKKPPVCVHSGTQSDGVHLCYSCTTRLWETSARLADEVERLRERDEKGCQIIGRQAEKITKLRSALEKIAASEALPEGESRYVAIARATLKGVK